MVSFTRSLFVALPVLAGISASTADAAPSAEQFTVRYTTTDSDGERSRLLNPGEHFLNRARCECGQSVHVEIRAKGGIDPAEPIEAFVGVNCDHAEEFPNGQFRPCAQIKVGTGADFLAGVTAEIHPVFFSNGVEPGGSRLLGDPETVAAGSCEVGFGQGGVSLCSPMANGIAGCQAEDFFLRGDELASSIRTDFGAPVAEVLDIDVAPREDAVELTMKKHQDAVELSWSVHAVGDIAGFRVLCEDAETGEPIAGKQQPRPGSTAIPNGTNFYTAGDLCPDGPFSSVQRQVLAGDGTCGDGVVQPGEECDPGESRAAGLCAQDCTLRVGAGLHALAWEHVCTGHLAFNTRSVLIGGLPDDRTFNFVLVSYDVFGNPRSAEAVLAVTPGAEMGCDCRTGPQGQGAWAMSLLLGLAALARRRRVTSRDRPRRAGRS